MRNGIYPEDHALAAIETSFLRLRTAPTLGRVFATFALNACLSVVWYFCSLHRQGSRRIRRVPSATKALLGNGARSARAFTVSRVSVGMITY